MIIAILDRIANKLVQAAEGQPDIGWDYVHTTEKETRYI